MANRTVKYNQCTIAYYIDNNKVSHGDEVVNTKLIENISKQFNKFTVSRRKKYKFLEMDI